MLAVKLAVGTTGLAVALLLDPIPVSSAGAAEAVWMYRGFMTVCIGLAVRYLWLLHKKIEACYTLPEAIETHDRHLRALVRILAAEAEQHGRKRASDALIQALQDELEMEDRYRRS